MELYNKIINIVDVNIIFCLFPLILTLIVIELVFRNKFKTKQVLNLIRWIIIVYTIITLLHFLVGITLFSDEFDFINRATGPYKLIYWLVLFSSTILPFTLLIKRLATKMLYVLFIGVFMKLGFYFERFVIIIISFHRDYVPDNWSFKMFNFPMGTFLMAFLQGFIFAILLVFFFELKERKRNI